MSTPDLEMLPFLQVGFLNGRFPTSQEYYLNFGGTVQFYAQEPLRIQALRYRNVDLLCLSFGSGDPLSEWHSQGKTVLRKTVVSRFESQTCHGQRGAMKISTTCSCLEP